MICPLSVPWPLHFHWPKFGIPGIVEISFGSSLGIFPCNLVHMYPVKMNRVIVNKMLTTDNNRIMNYAIEFSAILTSVFRMSLDVKSLTQSIKQISDNLLYD